MRFVRIRASQGLPKDYPLKPHHRRGYESVIAREFKRRVLDINGHFHGRINIKVLA
jgi:hypothetical protein